MQLGFRISPEGKVPIAIKESLQNYFNRHRNKFIELECKEKRKLKSHEQLGYWFGLIVPLFSEVTGYTEKEVHDILKCRAEFYEDKEVEGKRFRELKSFADATTTDIMAIVDKTKEWADYLNINIPDPDPLWKSG